MNPFRRQQANERARPSWRSIPAWLWTLVAVIAVALGELRGRLLTIARHAAAGTDQASAQCDAVITGLAAVAGVAVAGGLTLAFRRRRANDTTRPKWRPIPAWLWMLTAVIAVALTAFEVTTWLLTIASHAGPGTDQVTARMDAVRTGLAAGAGAGAAVGLMLAFRRQHHQEIATLLNDLDATERRITELYTKAVEQLGSEKAPVRLGGLYALERLAQDNPAQRATIVNVICAYLRMPFSLASPASKPAPAATETPIEPAVETPTTIAAADDTWQQERQVRLAAQRILSEHLRNPVISQQPNDSSRIRFWPGIRLDLTGAILIDFNLADGVVCNVLFSGATFSGDALFEGAIFNGEAEFDGATFNGDAVFRRAAFNGGTTFRGTIFRGATFQGYAAFDGATFSRETIFSEATFGEVTSFYSTTFQGYAAFEGATFNDKVLFRGAAFNNVASFPMTTFQGYAGFDMAAFNGEAKFDKAVLNGDAGFAGATFNGGPDSISFTNARACSSDGYQTWPAGWHLSQDKTGGATIVRTNASTTADQSPVL